VVALVAWALVYRQTLLPLLVLLQLELPPNLVQEYNLCLVCFRTRYRSCLVLEVLPQTLDWMCQNLLVA
jgi:hypothetical protein